QTCALPIWEGWKGWVPILNEMEILVRGGAPAYSIVFAFIPFVNLYYVYLRILAAHRIGALFGRGAGMTVLGVLIAPLWATLLAASQPVAGAPLAQRVPCDAPQPGAAPSLFAPAASPAAAASTPSGEPAPVITPPAPPDPPAPSAPAAFTPPPAPFTPPASA